MDRDAQEAAQSQIFSEVVRYISEKFELNISMCPANGLPVDDLVALQESGRICFVYNIKAQPWGSPVSNQGHLVNSVIYYGEPVDKGYSCIGYVIGCVNQERQAIEINLMEKRNDAGSEWSQQFLPLVIDAYAAYGLYLNRFKEINITRLVLVGPVPGVISYYQKHGFSLVNDYMHGVDAVTLSIVSD